MELCSVRETFGSRFFVFYTRGVGGDHLSRFVGAPSPYSSAAPSSPSRPSINRRPARFGLNAGVLCSRFP